MKFDLYTDVALKCEVPEHRLRRGDIVKLVDHHVAPDGTEGYSIEVFNALGETIAVTSVPASAIEALRQFINQYNFPSAWNRTQSDLFVYLVYQINKTKPNERDRPNRPERRDRSIIQLQKRWVCCGS